MSSLDEYVDSLYDKYEHTQSALEECLEEKYWKDKTGKLHAVSGMSDSHIRNTIRAIEKGKIQLLGFESDFIEMFTEELSNR